MSGGLKVAPPTTSVFSPDLFKGKVAFVTGGGSGICKGMTEAYLRHGAKCTIFSRTQSKLDAAADEMRRDIPGAQVLAIAGDVRNPEDIEAAMKTTAEKFGGIDIVIVGAAGNFLALAENLSYKAFKTVIDIDLLGAWNTCKAAFPYLKKSGNANIIAISATMHYQGTAMQVHPVAAKAGIDAMIRTLAIEWGRYGIRANIIAPGPIDDTEGIARLLPPAQKDAMIQNIPLRSMGTIRDIELSGLYLASDAARYVTGEAIIVDGGSYLTSGGGAQRLNQDVKAMGVKTGREGKAKI
ncbi:hypothetical protein DFJ74DRAFT_700025 [Hyaloraphidium curvatum]|nr:hypothetical protein DFJ74DRAFT_700025 [Hyaloraphidium curvatum]